MAALAAAQQPETPRIEYRERQLGPFNMEGRPYRLVLREAAVSGGQSADWELARTVVDIWFRDTAGRDLFHRSFPLR